MANPGLTSAEAARRLAEHPPEDATSSRSVRQIVLENTLTLFNLILLGFAVAMAAVQLWADLLFLGVLVVNTGIGIVQELRAKRTLDRLALLVAPRARVLRDGEERSVAVDEVVRGDAVRLDAGDQVIADGALAAARGLQLDESMLTGESDPVARRVGEQVRSGSFALAGGGVYVAELVGPDSYAAQIGSEAQAVRQIRSPLQLDIDRLLKVTVAVMLALAVLLIFALRYHEVELRESVATAAAGLITLVPEGLVLLTSIAFAVGAARMAGRGALVQRLNAVESLAGVDVVCVDKTGTLTDGTLALEDVVPLNGLAPDDALARVGVFAASLAGRNPTADAIAHDTGAHERPVAAEVPFSSRWKWSAIRWSDGSSEVLGAPEALAAAAELPASTHEAIEQHAGQQRRVLLFAEALAPIAEPAVDEEPAPPPLRPIALVILRERMRGEAAATVAYLARAGVSVKVISGDGPLTVEAVARAAGIDTGGRVITGPELPEGAAELARAAEANVVFARVQPDQKRRLVEALRAGGRRVAMVGDGVNDVPALKGSDVAVALGSGSQIAKGVSDIVLVDGDFAAIPASIEQGRSILVNVQRVAKLFVTKSVFAALLVLTVGIGGGAYPFEPRQLSLAALFTIGIPAFALALGPPAPGARAGGFLRDVMTFAVPAGIVTGLAVLLGHGLVHTSLERSEAQSQTTSVTILVFVGLFLVLVLESGGMRASQRRARLIPALCGLLALGYLAVLAWAPAREFFALAAPSLLPMLVALLCTAFAIGALGAIGMSLTRPGGERPDFTPLRRRG